MLQFSAADYVPSCRKSSGQTVCRQTDGRTDWYTHNTTTVCCGSAPRHNDHTVSFGIKHKWHDAILHLPLDNMWTFHNFFSVFWFYPLWDWNKLPDSYRDSAYLSTELVVWILSLRYHNEVAKDLVKKNQNPLKIEEHSQDWDSEATGIKCVLLIIKIAPKVLIASPGEFS